MACCLVSDEKQSSFSVCVLYPVCSLHFVFGSVVCISVLTVIRYHPCYVATNQSQSTIHLESVFFFRLFVCFSIRCLQLTSVAAASFYLLSVTNRANEQRWALCELSLQHEKRAKLKQSKLLWHVSRGSLEVICK